MNEAIRSAIASGSSSLRKCPALAMVTCFCLLVPGTRFQKHAFAALSALFPPTGAPRPCSSKVLISHRVSESWRPLRKDQKLSLVRARQVLEHLTHCVLKAN